MTFSYGLSRRRLFCTPDLTTSFKLIVLTSLALICLQSDLPATARALPPQQGSFSRDKLLQGDAERTTLQSSLRVELASDSNARFEKALATLKTLDEEGVDSLWNVAIANRKPALKAKAWDAYRPVRNQLLSKQYVPEIVLVHDSGNQLLLAERSGLDIRTLGPRNQGTAVALTPYTFARLTAAGVSGEVLYASITDLQNAARTGNTQAIELYSQYSASLPRQQYQVRVFVIDLSKTNQPSPGYSAWLGDREDIIASSTAYIAKMDIFVSDGSPQSINAYTAEHYTRHGFTVVGVFTPQEFSSQIGKYFPGRTFNSGPAVEMKSASVAPQLANGQFHSYQQTLDEFNSLASAHPDLAEVIQLGTTYEGRKLFALKVTRNPETVDPSKPDVLITGEHHAREWISVEPPIYFAHQLIDNYQTDDTSRFLVDHLQIWIMPVANPDGLDYSQQVSNFQETPARLWRKNRRPITVPGCSSGIGVDLNRNYNYEWRLPQDQPCPNYADDIGGSDDGNSEIYRGPTPASELEVQALQALTGDPSHHFIVRIDYHNFGQLIMYPYGFQQTPDVDAALQSTLTQRMKALALGATNTSYVAEQTIYLYPITGCSADYSYGVNNMPAPILVELRPVCCDFPIPESEITPINQESWAGAQMLLQWATGVPYAQSVQAYQQDADGTYSRLVYSAHWVPSDAGRELSIDARYQEMQPGSIQVRVQFSGPMDSSAAPVITMGRQSPFNEVTLAPAGDSQGWQKTVYANDTWVGQATIPEGGDTNASWRLSVSASDVVPQGVDADPSTVATYVTGTGAWQGYEGNGLESDTTNVLPPSFQPGRVGISVEAPKGGERLAAGDAYTVNWTLLTIPGFSPNEQQLWFSTDSGITFTELVEGIPPNVNSRTISIPAEITSHAQMRVVARDTTTGSATLGDSPANFTVGTNVGSGVLVTFVSSELLNQTWSDVKVIGASGAPSGQQQLAITLNITNSSQATIVNPFIRVSTLTKGDILISRDLGTLPASGGIQSINGPAMSQIAPGDSVQVTLMVGLLKPKKFQLLINVFGVPTGGSVSGGAPVTVWTGKPRTK